MLDGANIAGIATNSKKNWASNRQKSWATGLNQV
jgi:hypothetical protein